MVTHDVTAMTLREVARRTDTVAGFGLEVVLADGMVLRGHDGQQLAALVRGLR